MLDYGTSPNNHGIVVRGFPVPFASEPDPLGPLGAWVVEMPPGPGGYDYQATIMDTGDPAGDPEDDTIPMASIFGVATETVHRLHGLEGSGGSLLTGIHELNIFIEKDGQNARASSDFSGIIIGEFGGMDRKFIIGHEIGHWLQDQVAGGFGALSNTTYNYGPVACDPPHDPFAPNGNPPGCPHNAACQFFVEGTLEDPEPFNTAGSPNRHGIRSAEFSSGAMIEGFGHFVSAAAYNDLDTTGRYHYYKDIDEEQLPDYFDFEQGPDARQVELAGGAAASTVGGRSQWVRLECSEDDVTGFNDWEHPLEEAPLGQEVSSEIDWLRLFWQYATASYSGSDPQNPPGFWDTVFLVTGSQSYSPSWTMTVVWPRMDAAIDDLLNGNDWVDRWRELSGDGATGNAVYNDGT